MGVVAKSMDVIAKSLLTALLLVSQVDIIPAGPWRMGKSHSFHKEVKEAD